MRSKSQTHLTKPPKISKLNQISKQSLPSVIGKLVPKHLAVNKKKIVSLDNIQYKQPILDKIQREKKKYMKPLTDVQLILKKFDEVSQSKKSATQTPRINEKLENKFQTELDKRIKGLLSLPTVKNIKQKAEKQKARSILAQPHTATLAILAQGTRLSILRKYDQYIKKAVNPAYKKLKTDYH